MCRWGCSEKSKTFKCRVCGTKYCEACGRGDFHGVMTDKTVCQVCFQPKCQGERIGQDPGKSAQNKRTVNKKTVKAETSQKQSQDTRKT
ncbi:unnamed protein product [Porites lobata]|uniref:Uncharacterized protein n=1 Tax=Porites lobata TaxID=104759 RepID=A0ABN8RL84_9CNID|nr:unnamed protein product [Porites lobata]